MNIRDEERDRRFRTKSGRASQAGTGRHGITRNILLGTRNNLCRVSEGSGPAPGPTRITSALLLRVRLGLSQGRWGVLQ